MLNPFSTCGMHAVPVTLDDIAKASRVSKGAVSQVLNNPEHPRFAPATRRRILKAAQRLEYTPNRVASGLRRGWSDAISLVLPFNTPELLDVAQQTANAHNHTLTVQCTFQPDVAAERRALEMALEHQAAGLIWQPTGQASDYGSILPRLARSRTRVVLLERGEDILPDADVVFHDTQRAAEEAISHLQAAGYRTRIFVSRMERYVLGRVRQAQFKQAAAGRDAVLCCPLEQMPTRLREALDTATAPVGLYVDGDWTAMAMAESVEQLGLKIGRDVGLLMLGDMLIGNRYRLGEMTRPTLSAMQRQQAPLAERCVTRLIDRIAADPAEQPAPMRIPIRPELVPRQSTDRTVEPKGELRFGWLGAAAGAAIHPTPSVPGERSSGEC